MATESRIIGWPVSSGQVRGDDRHPRPLARHGDRGPFRLAQSRVLPDQARDGCLGVGGDHALRRGPARLPGPGAISTPLAHLGASARAAAGHPPFFGSSANGCRLADELLFKAGDADAVDEACRRSAVGKLLPNALYVHRTALDALDPLLRVFEGCARTYIGEIEGANLIKLHRQSGKVSYLVYPDFEINPHPAPLRSVKLSLRSREIDCLEYGNSPNPPVLHRKESFLLPEHPLHARFARLSAGGEARPALRHGDNRDPRRVEREVERRRVRRARAPPGSAEGPRFKGVGNAPDQRLLGHPSLWLVDSYSCLGRETTPGSTVFGYSRMRYGLTVPSPPGVMR